MTANTTPRITNPKGRRATGAKVLKVEELKEEAAAGHEQVIHRHTKRTQP